MEVSKVKGLGPKASGLLNKIGIYTVNDLVTHYPFRYDVLRRCSLKSQYSFCALQQPKGLKAVPCYTVCTPIPVEGKGRRKEGREGKK